MAAKLAIDLFCGLGGWTEGLLEHGFTVIGFDIERHDYGFGGYPAQLVIQDVLTLHGSQFKDAALIVASPPCQRYSYMAMPWSKAKEMIRHYEASAERREELNALFNACFRIQREASEAAGRHVPLIVENVRGAQRWVGRSAWNFGSYHLWGDVPALMPIPASLRKSAVGSWDRTRATPDHSWKVPGFRFDGSGKSFQSAAVEGVKAAGMNWSDQTKRGQDFTRIAGQQAEGRKGIPHRTNGHWTNPTEHERGTKGFTPNGEMLGKNRLGAFGSKSLGRKRASAEIAKIPFSLSSYIGKVYGLSAEKEMKL